MNIWTSDTNEDVDVVLATREEAEDALSTMNEIVKRYGNARVAEFYKLVGIERGDADVKRGWTDVRDATITAVTLGYKLKMPKACLLDEPATCEEETKDWPPHNIKGPEYYNSNEIEVIDVIEAFTKDMLGADAFCTGNIIKYACRWNKKGGAGDLKKIIWYAKYLLKTVKKEEAKQ
jgi:hypothetical protein